MAERRELAFSSLDEVMPEVDRLVPGNSTMGQWTLGQICNHLAGAVQGSIDGFSMRTPWLVRKTIGRMMLRKNLKSGRMPEGIKIPDEFVPKPGLDDSAEAEALRAALRRYAAHSGALADHPFFGPLTRDEWTRVHCIHCAHHLSFVRPMVALRRNRPVGFPTTQA